LFRSVAKYTSDFQGENYPMKNALCSFALMFALGMALVPKLSAQAQDSKEPSPAELNKKIEDLQQLVEQLRSELATVKQTRAPGPRAIAEVASTAMPPLPAAAAVATPEDQAPAAPEKPSIAGLLGSTTFSGFVDAFYTYNSNQPIGRVNALHNFDINSSTLGLNMIELGADKPATADSRLGYHVTLGFGQAMNAVNGSEIGPGGTEPNFAQYLKDGYLTYMAPVGSGLTVNVGKFVTAAGAEVIETKDNWNYTRGILFAWAIPYFHTGVSAKYAFNDKVALTGFLVNGWNNSIENNTGKTTGFNLALTLTKKLSWYHTYLVGPEQANDNSDFRHLYDTVLTYNPTDKLSLMANFDYGHDHGTSPTSPFFATNVWWSGIAGYVKYAPNDKWAVVGRGEYFKDHNGFSTGAAQNLSEFTFTLQRMLSQKLISRLEFRRDMSDVPFFPYRTGDFRDNQNTVTLGLVYAFTSADAK
jgi:Putative beta-barrel porin-2, OmpL-like. bbp2